MAGQTRVVGCFTALLFIANAVGLFFIWEQWKVANASQVDTREQLRAVVTYHVMAEFINVDKDSKITGYAFQPQFFNSGGTRTSKFVPWGSVHYFEGEVPNNLDLTKPWTKIDLVETVIGANGTGSIQPLSVSADDAGKVQRKEGVVLIWGQAKYADIFEPARLHTIGYCFKLESVQSNDGKNIFQPIPYRPDCNTNS